MRHLAKIGFSQSYTYFTWKNSRYELTEYVSELAYSDEREYFRPELLRQHAGHPARVSAAGRPSRVRGAVVLAATLSPSYGIYSGFENFENMPVERGSEEYRHSEKYEIRERTLDGPLLPMIQRVNEIRRREPRASASREHHLPRHRQRSVDRVRQASAGQHSDHGGQHRSASTAGRGSSSSRRIWASRRASPCDDLLDRRALRVADRAQLRRLEPGARRRTC